MSITSFGASSARERSGWTKALAVAALGVGAGLSTAVSAAPVEWETSVGGNGNSYDIVLDNTVGWDEARSAAQARGGDLAVITSAAEQSFIQSRLDVTGVTGSYWFGLRETAVEGTYENVNGEALSYTNWHSTEPNNGSGAETRGAILWAAGVEATDPDYAARRGKWNDAPEVGYPTTELPTPADLDIFRGGYVVEFAATDDGGGDDGGGTAIPIPAAALTFPLGAAFAGVFYRRMRRGR